MSTLSGRIGLITGASRGIGRACALALAASGADVAVNYHVQEEAAHETCSMVEHFGQRAISVQADVVAMLAANAYITGQTIRD